jgi:fructose-1-phosphate kinase PfkB-like protein
MSDGFNVATATSAELGVYIDGRKAAHKAALKAARTDLIKQNREELKAVRSLKKVREGEEARAAKV